MNTYKLTFDNGAKLTQQGGNAEAIHSALVLMQYQIRNEKN